MHKNVKEIETVLEKDSVYWIKIQIENREINSSQTKEKCPQFI